MTATEVLQKKKGGGGGEKGFRAGERELRFSFLSWPLLLFRAAFAGIVEKRKGGKG